MDRRLSMMLAGGCAMSQAFFLLAVHPVRLSAVGGDASRLPDGPVRVLGLDVAGFAVRDLGHVGGWGPQLVYVVLCAVLTYAVLRAVPGMRPRIGAVAALIGAALLAAGVAELLVPVLDPASTSAMWTQNEWLVSLRMTGAPSAPVEFALWVAWMPVMVWMELWLLRRWPPVQALVGSTGLPGENEAPEPALATARERRDVVFAGLIPVVLLAVAGGAVLRHANVRTWEQTPSLTFDPELWFPYRPPELIAEWSGLLYPALRLRPLATEESPGWRATLAVCLVLLAVLAVALRIVVRRAPDGHPMRFFLRCWYATLLASVAAAFVESVLLREYAPREWGMSFAPSFDIALSEAVRFGTAWGWVTGAVCLGALLVTSRRGIRTKPSVEEGRLKHAE